MKTSSFLPAKKIQEEQLIIIFTDKIFRMLKKNFIRNNNFRDSKEMRSKDRDKMPKKEEFSKK